MSHWLLLLTVCAALAALLLHDRRRRRRRWTRLFPAPAATTSGRWASARSSRVAIDLPLGGSASVALLILVLAPWPWAIPLAGVASIVAAAFVRRLEPGRVRAQRGRLVAGLPLVLDLLAAGCGRVGRRGRVGSRPVPYHRARRTGGVLVRGVRGVGVAGAGAGGCAVVDRCRGVGSGAGHRARAGGGRCAPGATSSRGGGGARGGRLRRRTAGPVLPPRVRAARHRACGTRGARPGAHVSHAEGPQVLPSTASRRTTVTVPSSGRTAPERIAGAAG